MNIIFLKILDSASLHKALADSEGFPICYSVEYFNRNNLQKINNHINIVFDTPEKISLLSNNIPLFCYTDFEVLITEHNTDKIFIILNYMTHIPYTKHLLLTYQNGVII